MSTKYSVPNVGVSEMNNRCCEEMEAFVGEIRKATAVYPEPCVFWKEDGSLDELGTFDGVPNLVFRFCPYCGKVLDGERSLVTKGDLLKQLRQAVDLAEASKMGPPLRRTAELEEAVDKIQRIVDKALASDIQA